MTETVTYIILAAIIAAAIYFVIKDIKKRPNADKELKEFLNDIEESVKLDILDFITHFDVTHLDNTEELAKLEQDFLDNLYNSIYDDIVIQIRVYENNGDSAFDYQLIASMLTLDKVKAYVNTIMDKDDSVQEKIVQLYNTMMNNKNKEIEEADKKLEEEQNKYDDGTEPAAAVPELDPTITSEADKEEKINPPKDIDDEYLEISEDDDTVEFFDVSDEE